RAIKAYVDLTGSRFPKVFHTNEGHAGFLGLERISDLVAGGGLTFDEALQVVRAGTVFTTHTPVSAGIDRFDRALVETYFSADLLPGVDAPDVLPLGAEDHEAGDTGMFNMAVMGLRLAQHANGVSKLHGQVSRAMFAGLWPGFDDDDVPITSVTNGVHAPTWTDPLLQRLAADRLGSSDTTQAAWAADALSDAELWRVRRDMRAQLVDDARARIARSWHLQNPGSVVPSWMNEVLDPDVLTIGFARRVPTYKRLTLMLHDEDRLRSILTSKKRPVQLVIAGKSHPADDEGKRLIQKLVQFASDPEVRRRIVFLPNYDIGMAQKLYPGTDVWLNNPLRPLEACGTSGMKAALNGALNLSILDGWWDEYFDGENGWAIPSSDASGDPAQRDALEAGAMYDLIEHQVAPRFYERDKDGVPKRWMKSVRHTLASLSPKLSADRMVEEYVEKLYTPAGRAAALISEDDYLGGRELAEWKVRIREAWDGVQVLHVESEGLAAVPRIGDELRVRAQVLLGGLSVDDVSVEVVYGTSREGDALESTTQVALSPIIAGGGAGRYGDGVIAFAGSVTLSSPGSFGYNVRVVPRHDALASPAEMGLIAVAS
ncbi:MAG: alpha-glucan family phosphorylase, partial [Naasia sp.]